MKRIIRVFPRKTKATPNDDLSFIGSMPRKGIDASGIEEIHISVAFTYDLPKVEILCKSWSKLGLPVKIGGPATGDKSGVFEPGMYMKEGYTITSRGCNNQCWFCNVWRRRG